VPTPDIDLPANTHCQHECRKGCAIYTRRPVSCQMWSCKWLLGEDVGLRPDRSGYVVDMMPDFVTSVDDDDGRQKRWPVMQVWVDPARPDAHKAPALRRWIEQQGQELRMMTIVRFGNDGGMLICPPSMSDSHTWVEKTSNMRQGKPNSAGEVVRELARQGIGMEIEVGDDNATIKVISGGHDAKAGGADRDPEHRGLPGGGAGAAPQVNIDRQRPGAAPREPDAPAVPRPVLGDGR
jgi:hypothetical protein